LFSGSGYLQITGYYAKINPDIAISAGILCAPVMELVDMQDLGSCVARRVGSSPFRRTKKLHVAGFEPAHGVFIFPLIHGRAVFNCFQKGTD
jgi:hypothetical protein